ncbi:MAG: MTH1187 family thiamine-binding protein [Candidatus Odinarchaeia archaeon]
MVIVSIDVIPIGTASTSLSQYVAEALKVLKDKKNIRYTLTPMNTVIEGENLREVIDIALEAHEAVFKAGAKRVVTVIKIDDRRDVKRRMEDKVESVEKKIR